MPPLDSPRRRLDDGQVIEARIVRAPNADSDFDVRFRRAGPRATAYLHETMLDADAYSRALGARDARFDGVFFVGITTTHIYCRPICPARVSHHDHRRFFASAAAAERAGYRPCLRCRPELAPGRALVDAVPRLARTAALRIAAGALNGRGVTQLAHELGVSERHLRRALTREIGVSPLELAQTHRLLLAKRLLADTNLSVTQVAYASGFQSLRRFNAIFRERYRMAPSAVRRTNGARRALPPPAESPNERVRLTLAYRPPLAWTVLLDHFRRDAIPGVELIDSNRYGRTVSIEGRHGVIFAEHAIDSTAARRTKGTHHLSVEVSLSLLPVLMPLLARLRQLFDLDAEPSVIDAHLERGGLGRLVRARPGIRLPGALDGFEVAFRILLRDATSSESASDRLRRVTESLGEPFDGGSATLNRFAPTAERVADAGAERLVSLGVARRRAAALAAVARHVAEGALRLDPGSNVSATRRALMDSTGIDARLATLIVMRALYWPDAFPASDRALWRTAGVDNERTLRLQAERWRPWRAYAALHLWLESNGH
jgi:AraC family transcriptional regulator, regulatory protein of adaptative response / DNA-3-methyladenine glycosylase II